MPLLGPLCPATSQLQFVNSQHPSLLWASGFTLALSHPFSTWLLPPALPSPALDPSARLTRSRPVHSSLLMNVQILGASLVSAPRPFLGVSLSRERHVRPEQSYLIKVYLLPVFSSQC